MLRIHQSDIQQQLRAKGVDPEHIKALHVKLQSGELDQTSFVVPAHRLGVPQPAQIINYSTTALDAGIAALRDDALLLFWLNGGAATRYGAGELANVAKGVTPVVNDISYLELKVRDLLETTKRYQLDVHPPVILMNSFVTDTQTREHFTTLFERYPDLDPGRFHFVIQQARVPRFSKATDVDEIDVFVDSTGQLSWAPCGHGDFIYLLREYFQEQTIPNVRYMLFANIDNVAATIDPALLGLHIQSGLGRTVEIVPKQAGEQGGLPCLVDNQMMILEEMKLPVDFPASRLPWLNTNTFWFSLPDLLRYDQDLPWILAEKTIAEGNVIQLERFACDVNLPSQYVAVTRDQRFWPIKRYSDLLQYQQQPEFKQLLRDRFAVEN
ncbi:MAG: UTP--glucose-1-phosphate uridylyltransferase [Candidatus Kerfeldbacteria bacterium]|nr:UTP--glucose-1-phosphate uridylyltransferase [Candidatus Kerfeldbacteria bacterium]